MCMYDYMFFILLYDCTLLALTRTCSSCIESIEWAASGIKKEKLIVHRKKSGAGQMWLQRDYTWALKY